MGIAFQSFMDSLRLDVSWQIQNFRQGDTREQRRKAARDLKYAQSARGFAALLEGLEHSDPETVKDAARMLGCMRNPDALSTLGDRAQQLLTNPPEGLDGAQLEGVVEALLAAIGKIGGQPAVNLLNLFLIDDRKWLQQVSWQVIQAMEKNWLLACLPAALSHSDAQIRRAAIDLLCTQDRDLATPLLFEVLRQISDINTNDLYVRSKALTCLSSMDLNTVLKALNILLERQGLLPVGEANALGLRERVCLLVSHEKVEIAQTAIYVLRETPHPSSIDILKDALRRPTTRSEAAMALKAHGYKPECGQSGAWYWIACQRWDMVIDCKADAIDPLRQLIENKDKEEDEDQIIEALNALSKIGGVAQLRIFARMLVHPQSRLRVAAVKCLAAIGGNEACEPLVPLLLDEDVSVVDAVTQALIKIGQPALIRLILCLNNDDPRLRRAAASVLQRVGWEPDQSIYAAWYWAILGNWEKCIRMRWLSVRPLLTCLQVDTWDRQCEILWTLGRIGAPETAVPLTEYFSADARKPWQVRQAAVEAAGEVAWQAGYLWPGYKLVVQERLLGALRDLHRDVRRAAAVALRQLDWQPVNDEDGAWYWIAEQLWDECVAIGKPAKGPLDRVLNHPDEPQFIRDAAADALARIYANEPPHKKDWSRQPAS